MKIFDCITYFDEPMLFEVRLNVLDKYVDEFIVAEALYTHSGKLKKINFNKEMYPKFKNRIKHIIVENEPKNIISTKLNGQETSNQSIYRLNAAKRIEFQRNSLARVFDKINYENLSAYLKKRKASSKYVIDGIIISSVPKYDDKDLKSVNRSGAADDFSKEKDKESEKSVKPVLKKMKKVLGDKVKDVKMSNRLSDSPSCIVADENDPTSQMQEIMKSMGQMDLPDIKPILEINPNHEIVVKLKSMTKQKAFDDIALLLYEQALIQEGVKLHDPSGFVNRLNKVITNNL